MSNESDVLEGSLLKETTIESEQTGSAMKEALAGLQKDALKLPGTNSAAQDFLEWCRVTLTDEKVSSPDTLPTDKREAARSDRRSLERDATVAPPKDGAKESAIAKTAEQSRAKVSPGTAVSGGTVDKTDEREKPLKGKETTTEIVFENPFKVNLLAGDGEEKERLRTDLPKDIPPPGKTDGNEKKPEFPEIVKAVQIADQVSEKLNASDAEKEGFKRPESRELSKNAEQRMKDMKDLTKWTRENFAALDEDKNGVISASEIAKKITDPKMANGDNAPRLVALHTALESMQEQFEGKDSKGLTKEGLARMEKLSEDKEFFRKGDRALAVKDLTKIFSHLDTEKKNAGQITPGQVDEALKRKDLSKEQRDALEDLRSYQKHLVTKTYADTSVVDGKEVVSRNDGRGAFVEIPKAEMGDLKKPQIAGYASEKEFLSDVISESMQSAKDRLQIAKNNPDLISQGSDGSCFFMSPLISLKQLDPKIMDKLIKNNNDGTHTVTFPGAPNEPITVKTPTDAEMAKWSSGQKAAILEKALSDHYVKHMVGNKEGLSDEDKEKLESPIPAARILRGHASDAFKLLTGREGQTFDMEKEKRTDDQLRDFLKESAKSGRTMVADTRFPENPGVIPQHGYALRFDEPSNSVILENPIKPSREKSNSTLNPYEPFDINGGAKDGVDDGIFKMSIAEFKKNFVRINYIEK